jgi:hypothetical protein
MRRAWQAATPLLRGGRYRKKSAKIQRQPVRELAGLKADAFGRSRISAFSRSRQRPQIRRSSGCSGAGKSWLLAELGRRGRSRGTGPPSRVKEQLYIGGDALPWGGWSLFVELTISRSIHHMVTAARGDQLSFFDRAKEDASRSVRYDNNHHKIAVFTFYALRR